MANGMRQPHARSCSGGQEHLLQQQQHENGAQLAADQRHVLEAGVEAAMLLVARPR